MKKGIYILFSGGYDSTFLVEKTIQSLKNKSDSQINLISILPTFSGDKAIREHEARKLLVNHWRKEYNIDINYDEIKIDVSEANMRFNKYGLSQPLFWLSTLMACVDYKYDHIYILFSYINGDQALFFRNEIENICINSLNIKSSNKVGAVYNKYIRYYKKPNIDVLFPLAFYNKEDIISMMINDCDDFIFDNCTTCEDPYDDMCGVCTPCKHLISTLKSISENKIYISDNIRSKCKEKLSIINDKIKSKDEPIPVD